MNRPDLAFDDKGSGEPLILLHAFPLDGRMWLAQRDELAGSARIIVPDLRGFGRSVDLPPAQSIDDYADDVVALLDKLRIERATVVGLSMGGYVALALARRAPHRLARLGLADTRSLADSSEGRKGRDQNIALVNSEGVPALVERLLPKLLGPNAAVDVITRARSLGNSQKAAGIAAALAAMRDRPDTTPVLARLDVPTAILVGEADGITPHADARAMSDALARAELHVLPGAGHLANLEAPAAFDSALARLLGA